MQEITEETLLDIAGYIVWCVNNHIEGLSCLANVGHDLNGLISGDKLFSPRTHGYAKHIAVYPVQRSIFDPRD
jgi:hypothetical protein